MFSTVDPATGDRLERFEYLEERALEAKLAAAATASQRWAATGVAERAALLNAVAGTLRTQCDTLAATAVREMGKPLPQARAEIEKCAWCCEYFAQNAAPMLAPQAAPSNAAHSYVAFRPLGVVFAIMPWNFPFWQLFRAAAPALLAGNGVLLKHAENTARCGLEIERIFREAGAPEDLFATLLISNERADALIADPRIAAVTLTGSERAGVAVASAAGAVLKKCVLELGGSDAFVVLADADLGSACPAAVTARFQNNGQSCIAAKRFIVVPEVYDEFVERFVTLAAAQRVGNPMDDGVALGPCARADLRAGVDAQVRDTVAGGARLNLGGKTIAGAGFFYEATIVSDVVPGMRMFDEEVFGPAAAIVRARDAEDAIALANASSYGLGFSIWTRDTARAEALAPHVQAGAVFVNAVVASDPRLPFGGVKKSGYGRELSAFGVHEFANVQTVWLSP
ncbi:MAG TPA: NAD-dependent succinate-semialdehyde dehydrogenase [Candidatus Tumulicola sp.]